MSYDKKPKSKNRVNYPNEQDQKVFFLLRFWRRYKIKSRFPGITKRQRFVAVSLILSLGLVVVQLLTEYRERYYSVAGLSLAAYFLFAWGLREEIEGVEWLTLFILPVFFSLGVGFFYFLIPVRWLTRIPAAVFYGVGIYTLFLTENIFNVAASRTIQLLRAASTVGFVLTLITVFLLTDTLFSFHLEFWQNAVLVFLIFFFLALQSLWSVHLEEEISREVFTYSLVSALIMAEWAAALSFWPLTTTTTALIFSVSAYEILGVCQHWLSQRLQKSAIREFVLIGAIALAVLLYSGRWGG